MLEESVQPAADTKRRMEFVTEAGQMLLENGGEVFRVQQTMHIMARSLGLNRYNVYVISNGIFSSAETDKISVIRHVPKSEMHLGRVAAINDLSRKMASGKIKSLDDAEKKLAEIRQIPPSSGPAQVVASAGGAAFFCMVFGGSFSDAAVAAVSGVILALFLLFKEKIRLGGVFAKLLGSSIATLCCLVLSSLFPAVNNDLATIGTLFILTPGVAFTTGVRDIVHSDYISGMIHLADALLSAGAMAMGVGLVYGIAGLIGGAV